MDIIKNPGIIGSGSWATALAKIIHDKGISLNWHFRNPENIDLFRKFKHNPNYLTGVEFDTDKIQFSSNLSDTVEQSDIIILAVPSAFLKKTLQQGKIDFKGKIVVSAIKGIIPEENMIVGPFLNQFYQLPLTHFCVISGPSHAEEVGMERLSYLTIAGENLETTQQIADLLVSNHIQTTVSDDIYGTEFSAVLKNIIAIAAGICNGLHYGDNFQAVLVSNGIQEIKRFVDKVHPIKRDIKSSAYLGDLLVTTYSQFSRNRMLGTMVGKGYSVKSTLAEMTMVAEGYYAVKWIHEIMKKEQLEMPITQAVYKIFYEKKSPKKVIRKLTKKLK